MDSAEIAHHVLAMFGLGDPPDASLLTELRSSLRRRNSLSIFQWSAKAEARSSTLPHSGFRQCENCYHPREFGIHPGILGQTNMGGLPMPDSNYFNRPFWCHPAFA